MPQKNKYGEIVFKDNPKYIKDFIKSNKFSPSYEEIKQLSRLNSKSVVHSHIHRLIARGWIKNGNGRNRSISIV